ncbi:MAG TPA: DUF3034 family protein [Caulobacteraceae bacterium]|jgi:hypothetical protein
MGFSGRMAAAALAAGVALVTAGAAEAHEWQWGGKLDLTRGVANVEGAGGGGLATWALITGNETRDGIGGELSATYINLPAYSVRVFGGGVGLFDRVEATVARATFDTGATGAKLGLGRGFTFDQTILGAKVRLLGDAVYDQSTWLPQVAAGLQYKANDRGAIVRAVGADHDADVDVYIAATKILLDQSLVLSATARATRANQFGFLGFGGDRSRAYAAEFEGSAAYLLTAKLAVGAEYRSKPDNLSFAREAAAFDVFVAYALTRNLSVTAAYVDLGDIATFRGQRGAYVSLQAGF